MNLIKTLYQFKYDFTKIPVDLLESVSIILRNTSYNSKIDVLDTITFNAIRDTQPNDPILENLYELNRNTTTIQDNNGFNSKYSIDQAAELFDDSKLSDKSTEFYKHKIPAGHVINEIVFEREIYNFLHSREWLLRNNFKTTFPTITEKQIVYKFDDTPGPYKKTYLTDQIYSVSALKI